MEAILSVPNLVKRFGGLVAVNRVSLDVNAGEVVGLVGDNAAGESTLIKCISGVYQADEGEISFQGKTHRRYQQPGNCPIHGRRPTGRVKFSPEAAPNLSISFHP